MKRILASLFISGMVLFSTACGSSKADTTAQLLNELTFRNSSWNASMVLAGATMTSATGSWGPKVKLNNCDTQTAVLTAPDGIWTFANTEIVCEKHNLYVLSVSNSGNLTLGWSTGNVK